MIRLLLLFSILLTALLAKNIEVSKSYFIDTTNTLSIQEVLQKKFLPLQKSNLGVIKNSVWLHLNLKNTTNTELIKRVHAKRSGLDFVDVFVMKNKQLFKNYSLGDMREHEKRDNIFRSSYFDIRLKPLEKIDVFIKHRTYATMDIRWELTNKEQFDTFYNKQAITYAFISGILLVTVIMSLLLFVFLKTKFYLIYAVFTIFTITFQLSFAGFFYQFGMPIYLTNFFNYFVSTTGGVILGLFPLYFFNLKKYEFKYLILVIKVSISLSFILACFYLFYPLQPELLYNSKYTNLTSLITVFSLTILALRLFLAKKEGSFFYLLANLFFVAFVTVFIFGLIGLIEYSSFYYYTLPTGTIGQDLFLGLALIHATYLIKKENDKKSQLLNEYAKLSFIGQTMLNISHQWKSPINAIYNSINHIEAAREFEDKNLDTIINTNLQKIKATTQYLKDTALNQLNFYKNTNHKEHVNIANEIRYVTELLGNELNKQNINIIFTGNKALSLHLEKNYFLNIVMVLLENAFKVFKERKILSPTINIDIQTTKHFLELRFSDNAGGLSESELLHIFKKDYSTSGSTGVGLYLAKEIITQKLQGSIKASNQDNGLCFYLRIKHHSTEKA